MILFTLFNLQSQEVELNLINSYNTTHSYVSHILPHFLDTIIRRYIPSVLNLSIPICFRSLVFLLFLALSFYFLLLLRPLYLNFHLSFPFLSVSFLTFSLYLLSSSLIQIPFNLSYFFFIFLNLL